MTVAPDAPRPRIELAALQTRAGARRRPENPDGAWPTGRPSAIPLMAARLADAAMPAASSEQVMQVLQTSYKLHPSLDVLDALPHSPDPDAAARLVHAPPGARAVAGRASRWLAGEKLEHEQAHPYVQNALEHAVKPLRRYRCAACGFEAKQHFWQCPGCQAWDSYPATPG
jgi:lipopolysaccharide biosynthesis regulator YciM